MLSRRHLTDSQTSIVEELEALSWPESIALAGHSTHDTDLIIAIDVNTSSFTKIEGGLPVNTRERLYLIISPSYPWVPPQAHIDHDRWEGYPHVLQGYRLCLYLDPATEWNPLGGMQAYLRRLWDWLADAAENRFDPATALYHPVGGVFHRTEGAPTIVVTAPLGEIADGFRATRIVLSQRSDLRVDLLAWDRAGAVPNDAMTGVLVVLSDAMPRGGGRYLSDLAVTIRGQDSRNQRKQLLTTVAKAVRSLRQDQHLHVIIAVPNRHLAGEARVHLIGWRLPQPQVAKALKIATSRHKHGSPHPDGEPLVDWTYVDDGRTGVMTRRDHARPVNWFADKNVELWGCGALGSWVAEYLVRAGVRTITLRDPGYVTTGILVRQNYRELDVGRAKADALADRLREVSDQVTVRPKRGLAQSGLSEISNADIIVDCTVNTAVAVAVEQQQTVGDLAVPVIQIATDNETATLGILTVTTGEKGRTTNDIDRAMHDVAAVDATLNPYLAFWDPENHPSLTPTVGCSVPTFHGSVADASAVGAGAISLAATALSRRIAGGYLFAAAHTPYAVPRCVTVPAPWRLNPELERVTPSRT